MTPPSLHHGKNDWEKWLFLEGDGSTPELSCVGQRNLRRKKECNSPERPLLPDVLTGDFLFNQRVEFWPWFCTLTKVCLLPCFVREGSIQVCAHTQHTPGKENHFDTQLFLSMCGLFRYGHGKWVFFWVLCGLNPPLHHDGLFETFLMAAAGVPQIAKTSNILYFTTGESLFSLLFLCSPFVSGTGFSPFNSRFFSLYKGQCLSIWEAKLEGGSRLCFKTLT